KLGLTLGRVLISGSGPDICLCGIPGHRDATLNWSKTTLKRSFKASHSPATEVLGSGSPHRLCRLREVHYAAARVHRPPRRECRMAVRRGGAGGGADLSSGCPDGPSARCACECGLPGAISALRFHRGEKPCHRLARIWEEP